MALAAAKKAVQKPAPKADKAYVFAWEGTDRKGNRVKGETRSSSVTLVRAELRRQGVNPTKVNKKAGSLFGGGKKKITSSDIAVFSRQLATMMAAGVPEAQIDMVKPIVTTGGGDLAEARRVEVAIRP
jgi:type IV pilus assembly protein PilC